MDITIGVFVGGLLVLTNLIILDYLLKKGFKPKEIKQGNYPKKSFYIKLVAKTAALFTAVVVCIYYLELNWIGFIIGISVSFISFLILFSFNLLMSKEK